jgi:hypothetical protein
MGRVNIIGHDADKSLSKFIARLAIIVDFRPLVTSWDF